MTQAWRTWLRDRPSVYAEIIGGDEESARALAGVEFARATREAVMLDLIEVVPTRSNLIPLRAPGHSTKRAVSFR